MLFDKISTGSLLTPQEQASQSQNSKTLDDTLINNIGLSPEEEVLTKNDASDVGDFMTLFLAQLQNQDPTDPAKNEDFVAQLAQFESVESLQKLDDTIQTMADSFKSSQILEATNLIGKKIEVPTNKMSLLSYVDGDGNVAGHDVTGVMQMPDVSNYINDESGEFQLINDLRVTITNSGTGEVIQQFNMGAQVSKDQVPFTWNGADSEGNRIVDSNGAPIVDGDYIISAEALIGDKWIPSTTTISTNVDSVSIDGGQIIVNASGVGSISLTQLDKISN